MELGVVVLDRRGGVLEAVAREHAHHRGPRWHLVTAFDQAGHGGGTGGLAEHALTTAQQLVGLDDLGVGDSHEIAVALASRLQRPLLIHRVTDADGGGDRVGLLHRVAQHQGG